MSLHPLIEYTRGGLSESVHSGTLVVVAADGGLVAAAGDPEARVFVRSSGKPFQALPVVSSGAAEAWGMCERELALACASHRGSAAHLTVACGFASRLGLTAADLQCGTHEVEDRDTEADLIRSGTQRDAFFHNCSGKHLAMLATALHLGQPTERYLAVDGAVQQGVLAAVSRFCDVPVDAIGLGIDGCSAPNFALPLRATALGVARLLDPDAPAEARTVTGAMMHHPEMVQGDGGFDTEIMRLLPGRVIAKRGAEGVQIVGLAPHAGRPALGLAVKIADGSARAAVPAIASAMAQLGLLTDDEAAALRARGWLPPAPQRNWSGLLTGETRQLFNLKS
jgi:L-asparaginase II